MGKGARTRKERAAEGGQKPAEQSRGGSRVYRIVGGIAGVLALCLLVFGILYSTGFIQRNMTAMTVGDAKISGQEYAYYYNILRSNFYSSNESYLAAMGITDSNLEDAMYDEDRTFGEYFRQQTASSIQQVYELYNEAQAQGYTMSEEGQTSFDSNLASIETAAQEQGVSAQVYLQNALGMTLSMDDYKDIVWKEALGNDFYENTQAKEYTDADLEGYYRENADQFDLADYRVFQVYYDADDEASKTQAKEKAEEFAAQVTDERSFIRLARENAAEDQKEQYAEDDGTLTEAAPLYASGTVIDWVKDPARKTGDVEVLEISTNYSVMYFVDRYLDESSSVDIRHILLRSDETNDAEIKQQAEELLQQWKDGEATEDSFADLARQHSADGNASSGGIYTGVNDSTNFVEPFKEWCLDESRRVGDTGIVKTDYGYHIMYFSASRPAWQSSAESALSNQDYSDYLDQLAEKYSSDISETIVNLVL